MSSVITEDWIPIRFFLQNGQPYVEWCYLGHRRFIEPFFEETISQCMRHPFNQLFRQQTSVDVLLERHRKQPGLPPTGFIFHMSRCGSTLVAQMLASLRQNIVLSEASPIDDVLNAHRADPSVTDSQRIEWLQAMVGVLGLKRNAAEKHLFIKFDCWHTQDLPLIRAAFPRTPWIFLYRDPIEVMASQIKKRGTHLVPTLVDSTRFGIAPDVAIQMPAEEIAGRILASILQAAVDHRSIEGGMYVNYDQLPQAVTTTIATHFGINWSASDIARMYDTAQFDAKNPHFTFERTEINATDALSSNTRQWLSPLYEKLESSTF